ncbi:MAG: hypothetical protein QNJ73_06170 [Gammaproteobacteria bacterium]|nr:hypothetical protein [Gammaproteobacteria bacterium]
MQIRPLCSKVLMDISESRIELMRWERRDDQDDWFIQRLFETPATYQEWESFHFGLMKQVGSNFVYKRQLVDLRQAQFTLLHRQGLFDHLRNANVTGKDREHLMAAFFPSKDYSKATITEHRRFVLANSSLFCADYLGTELLDDERFNAELERYRDYYMEFFALYCDWILAQANRQPFPLRGMLKEMKTNLTKLKSRLIQLPCARDRRAKTRALAPHH